MTTLKNLYLQPKDLPFETKSEITLYLKSGNIVKIYTPLLSDDFTLLWHKSRKEVLVCCTDQNSYACINKREVESYTVSPFNVVA